MGGWWAELGPSEGDEEAPRGIFKENTLEQQLLDSCTRFPHSGFPAGLEGKASACNVGDPDSIQDVGSIPGSGRSPGEGNGNPLQYSCLKNPLDSGAWQATIHGVTNSWTVPPASLQMQELPEEPSLQPWGCLWTGPVPWGDMLRASSTRLHGLLPPSCLHFYGHTQQQTPGFLLVFLKHQLSWGHDGDTCPHLPHLFSPGPAFKLALHGLIHHH